MDEQNNLLGLTSTDSSDNSKLKKMTTILRHQLNSDLTDTDSQTSTNRNETLASRDTITFAANNTSSSTASISTSSSDDTNERKCSFAIDNDDEQRFYIGSMNRFVKIAALDDGVLKDNWHSSDYSPTSSTPIESDVNNEDDSLRDLTDVILKPEKTMPVVPLQQFGEGHEDKTILKAWSKIIIPKKTSLVDKVRKFLLNNETPDLKVKIGDHQFSCYYTVLICYSEFFMKNRYTSEVTLPITEVTPAAFEATYAWMLKDNSQIERDHIIETLNAATYLQISDLERQIWYCIESLEYFVEIEAFLLLLESINLRMQPFIEEIMVKRISKFFLTAITTVEYLSMSAKTVALLLGSDSIAVNTEKEVLFAAFLWVNHNWAERSADVKEVFSAVRMIYLPIEFLMQLKNKTPYVAINRVIESEGFKNILNEAIFAKTLKYYGGNNESFVEIYSKFQIPQLLPHVFIYDSHCKYHKRHPNDKQDSIEYIDFINYLRILQVEGQCYWEELTPKRIEGEYTPN